MTASEAPAQIVARFLRANHYDETLEVFLREAGLPEDAGTLKPGAWTIEQILQEKIQYDTSLTFEKQGTNDSHKWSLPAPSVAHEPQLEISSNVLCVSGNLEFNRLSVTSADRAWKQCSATSPFDSKSLPTRLGDSPVLSTVFAPAGFVLSTSMSGHLAIRQSDTLALIDECRHHMKYAVHVASYQHDTRWLIATAGWDQKIHIYAPDLSRLQSMEVVATSNNGSILPGLLDNPVHSVSLISNPESLIFVKNPDTQAVYLVASRRDSTHLYYYRLDYNTTGKVTVYEAGRQNLAPHSNAWVAFTPCSLTPCPTDPTLIATATSHIPHMKLIIARLLFPDTRAQQASTSAQQTLAQVARAELASQDREDAAINIQVSTMAPQTPYSTPQVVWRPDGSGLFVNGDDGVIRGIETATGKVVSLLKRHEAGSKVRTLWAGFVKNETSSGQQEVLVSGGFDKKIFVWTSTANT